MTQDKNTDATCTVAELKDLVRDFIRQRDWEQFHTPKDLGIGLSIEVAELLEHFRFRSDSEIEARLDQPQYRRKVGHELADVLYFVLALSNQLDFDASQLLREKMALSAKRYPIEKARGKNLKYTELDTEEERDLPKEEHGEA
jgi:dCTP diphosphatase